MTTATQRAKPAKPDLLPSVHKYRVMLGEEIIGQFSNVRLADRTAHGAVVLDVSVQPHKIVYKDGKWLEKPA